MSTPSHTEIFIVYTFCTTSQVYVSLFTDNEGVQVPITMITYNFAGAPEHKVAAAPHGNSKQRVKYVCHMKSVKSKLSEALAVHTPKEAMTKVLSESGGIVG